MNESASTYQDLIKEAFIDPIRTVTVIDDEYPMLQELLQKPENAIKPENPNIARLINISKMCHETHKWSLDVFNGKSPKIGDNNYIPEHLHHSDLLILDYHLDGDADASGQRARQIIEKLNDNNHFNIILVHTKGIEADIKSVFEEILADFYELDSNIFSSLNGKEDAIESWIDEHSENFEGWFNADYAITAIGSALSKDSLNILKSYRAPKHIFYPFSDDIHAAAQKIASEESPDFSIDDLVLFRLKEIFDNSALNFGTSRDDFSWDWNDDGQNYISTGKIFLSVVHKSSDDPEDELYTALCESLKHFDASPMHLLMAKIRHEIDDRGLEQAQSILLNRPAQAGWLYSLLADDKDSLAHDKAIDLHWEQLGRASKSSLRDFSRRLVESFGDDKKKDIVKRFFHECIGNSELSCGHLNAFSCSMPVVSKHLTTGTVFSIDDEFWVCLTPACDLVPGQKTDQWCNRIGIDHLAFKAVQLHEGIKLATANSKANNNEFIYLNLDPAESPKVLSFNRGENPIWDIFYATNQGRFSEKNTIGLSQVREIKVEETEIDDTEVNESDNNESSLTLSIKKVEAKIVAELRYEYALNLLQRLGANQTRVGLDFIQKARLWS